MCAISTGDLLREEIQNQTPLGIKANIYMARGDLVPDQDILEMIQKQYKKYSINQTRMCQRHDFGRFPPHRGISQKV